MAKRQPVQSHPVIDHTEKIPLKHQFKISILRSPVSSDRLLGLINEDKSIFTDCRKNLNHKIFKEILHKNIPVVLGLYFKNKDIYALEFVQILSHFLKLHGYRAAARDQILTSAQEAYANAFLWSSLDLEPIHGIRPIDFFLQIENQLQDKNYAERYMGVYVAKYPSILEIAIFVEGAPIVWPPKSRDEKFRGINLIRSLTDKVTFDPNGEVIRLHFLP